MDNSQDLLTRRLFLAASGLTLSGMTNIALDVFAKPKPQNQETWQLKRVLSGQTIEAVPTGSTKRLRIRLIGISAPALDQDPWGLASRQHLEELIGADPFVLERDTLEKDSTDRLLGYVWTGGQMVNLLLVEQGYVMVEVIAPNERYLQQLDYAQAKARLLGLGIWDTKNPMRFSPKEHFRLKQQRPA